MNKWSFFFNILIIILFSFSFNNVFSENITINTKNTTIKLNIEELDREDIFIFLWKYYWRWIPKTYKYIKLHYIDIKENTELYKSLQKLVYLDIIENKSTAFWKNKKLNSYIFYKLLENIYWNEFIYKNNKKDLKNRNTNIYDLKSLKDYDTDELDNFNKYWNSSEIIEKKAILVDVYNTLLNHHFNKDNLDEVKIIESGIDWLTKWIDDKHTVYFPPIDTNNFYENLNWEYEWIGSYVDMEKPWEVRIVSPITGSPSMKAWLKWWDVIIKVDWKEISKENSLKEVITWIKWPAWTKVMLTIKRWAKIFNLNVIRAKIVIKDVEYKVFNNDTFYIEIKSFWDNVWENFRKALNELKNKKYVNKVIIDLRNNWWWYLWEVTNMLSYFIEKWEPTAIVKYKNANKSYYSKWYDLIDFSKYKIIILQNSWTASASEIMIWSIKDYFPDSIIVWEKSYWKWSVQTIKSYTDWSSLKYTIAKWFTWKNEIWIDWIWIMPDFEIEFDIEKYKNSNLDNQLQKARSIR